MIPPKVGPLNSHWFHIHGSRRPAFGSKDGRGFVVLSFGFEQNTMGNASKLISIMGPKKRNFEASDECSQYHLHDVFFIWFLMMKTVSFLYFFPPIIGYVYKSINNGGSSQTDLTRNSAPLLRLSRETATWSDCCRERIGNASKSLPQADRGAKGWNRVMAGQPTTILRYPHRNKALWSGLINHWFSLIKRKIKPVFPGGCTLGGRGVGWLAMKSAITICAFWTAWRRRRIEVLGCMKNCWWRKSCTSWYGSLSHYL